MISGAATIQVILLNGTTADANEVMANEYEIYSNIDNTNIATNALIAVSKLEAVTGGQLPVGNASLRYQTRTITGDLSISNTGVATVTTGLTRFVPIGTIISFYDFNAALIFNSTIWAYCNGQSIAVGTIGVQTLPDLSGRYIVGFGTDGGGNNGSAAWATPAVGNAGNTINIAHTHTVASHTHDLGNHTHTGGAHTHTTPNHTHAAGSLYAQVSLNGAASNAVFNQSTVSAWAETLTGYQFNGVAGGGGSQTSATTVAGTTANDGGSTTGSAGAVATGVPSTNTSGAATPATDSQLSTTQSIQPISIRVRYLMRIL